MRNSATGMCRRAGVVRVAAVMAAQALAVQTGVAQAPARPVAPAAVPYVFPPIASRTLSNGIPVAIVEDHETPIVTVRVVIDSSPLIDPAGKRGLFSIMLSMLPEGTTTRTADDLANAFAAMGSTIAPSGFTALARDLDGSVTLLADILAHPSFPDSALTRIKRLRIQSATAKPAAAVTAAPLFTAIAYGADHPRALHPDSASLARITRADVIAMHDSYVRPENISLVVVGDVTSATVMPMLERAFGGMPRGGTKVDHALPPPKPLAPTTIYLVDAPADTQVFLYTGHLVPAQSSSEYFALDLLNMMVAGPGESGRLWDALRTQHEFAYAVGSNFAWQPAPLPGTWFATAAVNAARTDSALTEWLRVFRELARQPPTPDEIAFARQNRIGNVPLRLETTEALAGQLADLVAHQLPLDFMTRYGAGIEHVTSSDLLAAARAYLDPDHLVIVAVGPRARFEAALRAANIAPIIVVDRNGHPTP